MMASIAVLRRQVTRLEVVHCTKDVAGQALAVHEGAPQIQRRRQGLHLLRHAVAHGAEHLRIISTERSLSDKM